MDQFNYRILKRLQIDSTRSISALAEEIGLSTSACHRRIQLMEKQGMICGYSARLKPSAIGLKLEVFVEI